MASRDLDRIQALIAAVAGRETQAMSSLPATAANLWLVGFHCC